MKKVVMSVVAIAMAFAFAGCTDTSTPANVLGAAAKAVKENNVKAFRNTLAGDAFKRFGNAEGLKTVRARFNGKSLTIQNVALVKEVVRQGGFIRTYGVDVVENAKRVAATKVVCTSTDVDYQGDTNWYPSNSAIYVTQCWITELN